MMLDPYEHRLRRFADLCDSMSEVAAELAGGAESASTILCLARLRSELELTSQELRAEIRPRLLKRIAQLEAQLEERLT